MSETNPQETQSTTARPAWPLLGLAVLSVLAMLDAAVLTHTHSLLLSQPGYESFCDISAKVSCDSALASHYSKLFGVPVALFALVSYGLLLIYSLVDLKARNNGGTESAGNRIFALTLWHLAFSLYMAGASAVDLEVLCPLCAGLYAIALVAVFLAFKNLPEGIGGFASGLADELGGVIKAPKNALPEGAAILGAIVLIILFQTTNIMKPGTDTEGGTPVTAKSDEAVSRDEVHQLQKYNMRKWLDSFPEMKANPGPYASKGTAGAPMQIVEFADLQCPACKRGAERLDIMLKDNPGKMEIHFRHFPLSNKCNPAVTSDLHPYACRAALAAICANEQGKFWEWNDQVFLYQPRLNDENIGKWAEELGFNMKKFHTCMDAPSTRAMLDADVAEGISLDIHSTPTVIVNGRFNKHFLGLKDEILNLLVEVESER